MRLVAALLILLTVLAPGSGAQAAPPRGRSEGGRALAAFFGLGGAKSTSKLKLGDAIAVFDGFRTEFEFGVDIPASASAGFSLSAGIEEADQFNVVDEPDAIERARFSAQGVKIGFYYGSLGLGYGISQGTGTIKEVAVDTGLQELAVKGTSQVISMSLNFDFRSQYRFALEGQNRFGKYGDFKSEELSGALKFFILFGL